MTLTNGTILQFIEDKSPDCDYCQLDSWKCSCLEDNGKSPICEYKGYFRIIQPPKKDKEEQNETLHNKVH